MILHKVNWNYEMTQTILVTENYLKINIMKLKQGSMNSYTPWLIHHFLGTALHIAACQQTTTPHNHLLVA